LLFLGCKPTSEIEIFIPIHGDHMPPDVCLTHPLPEGLKVRVSGAEPAVRALSQRALKYTVDLSSVKSGIQTIAVDPVSMKLPKGIQYIGATPARFTLQVEKKTRKRVPVILTLSGQPAPGFVVAHAAAHPATVVVEGGETVLIPISEIKSKPLDIAGSSETFKKELALAMDRTIRVVEPGDRIFGTVVIEEKPVVMEFHHIPVKGEGAVGPYNINPPVLSIVVKGSESVLSQLTPEQDISVSVDLKGLASGVYVRRAAISLPVKTTLLDAKPDLFTIDIKEK